MNKRDLQQPTKGNTGRKSENEKIVRANIIFFVRPNLSRRAKALVKLLKPFVPDFVIKHVEHELASETRRDQNEMVDYIFAILVDSNKISGPKDPRLILKVTDIAHMLVADIDPFKLSRRE